jgi:hypothetical protein
MKVIDSVICERQMAETTRKLRNNASFVVNTTDVYNCSAG